MEFKIIVNGSHKEWEKSKIGYIEVVDLAFTGPHGPNDVFTVQYSRGPKENPQGSIVEGQSVTVKSGMVFDVSPTTKS